MNAGFTARLRRRADRMLRPGARAVILLYHRIADEAVDPFGLCVSPEHFEQHLRAIRGSGRPTHLIDLARGVQDRGVRDGAVCVTFDDAYADNLEVAKPLLERYDVPATAFVTTGGAGRDREFWWDELERVFLRPGRLPRSLRVEIDGRAREWNLGGAADLELRDLEAHRDWRLPVESLPTARHAVFRELYELLQPLAAAQRTRVMDSLLAWAGIDPTDVRPSRRVLEPREVVDLGRGGLIEVAAHTVSHPVLPSQSAGAQRDELNRSKADLEDWLGTPVLGFAYPYGLHDGVSAAAARAAGFAYACSGLHASTTRDSDPYALPRVQVNDFDGSELSEWLRWYLN